MAPHEPNLSMDTRDNERNPRQMMASCLSKLHSDPMFSIALISPLGPHSGSGAVPRTPATPPHSPPLRDRPGDALFSMFRRPPGSTNAKQRTACKGRQCEPSLSETAHVSLGCCSALLLLSLLLVWRFRPSVFPFQPRFCRRAPRSRSQKNNLSQG